MLTLHAWPTPNGKKIFVMLEELEIPHETRFVDIHNNQQFAPDFLAISPNNKIPALVDHDADGGPLSIFESCAILTYLADTHRNSWPLRGTPGGRPWSGYAGRMADWGR